MEAMLEQRERRKWRRRKRARPREPQEIAAAAGSEVKLESERIELSQSIRAVYRKLASALHPDREPDAAERDRKTS
jgi:hypothetical protein